MKIEIDMRFVEKTVMPVFEGGYKAGEERAFALLGSEGDVIRVEDWIKVPESYCRKRGFEPLPREFEERVRRRAEGEGLKKLGYLHSHLVLEEGERLFLKPLLSMADWREMCRKRELIRGVCVLPVDEWKQEEIAIPSINSVIVFWHVSRPAVVPIRYGKNEAFYGLYLLRGGSKENWMVSQVESG